MYSTGNSTQCSVMAIWGKKILKSAYIYIYIYMCLTDPGGDSAKESTCKWKRQRRCEFDRWRRA